MEARIQRPRVAVKLSPESPRVDPVPTLVCRQCDFKMFVPPDRTKFGMMCPECHGANMKPVDRRRRQGGSDVKVRPAAIRSIIGGLILFPLGAGLVLFGLANWNAGRFGARMIGWGVVLLIAGMISLLVGGVQALKDLSS